MDSGTRSALTSTGNSNALNPTNVEIKLFDSFNGGKQIKTNDDIISFSTNANTTIGGHLDVSGQLHCYGPFISGTLVQLLYLNNMKIFTNQFFTSIQLPNQSLMNVNFANSNLSNANFSNTNLSFSNLSNCNVSNANFSNAIALSVNWSGANVTNIILDNTKISHIDNSLFNNNGNSSFRQEINPIGLPINGTASSNRCGYSVALSANGQIIAISSPYNSDVDDRVGQVRIFSNTWTQIGSSLHGLPFDNVNHYHDEFGTSLSLSSDGQIVAIGAPNFSTDISHHYGYCKVFQYKDNGNTYDWEMMGQMIGGYPHLGKRGTSIGLSANGTVIAIGDPQNNCVFIYSFRYTSSEWILKHTITTGGGITTFGSSLSLAKNANIIVCGTETGLVKVYSFNDSSSYQQIGGNVGISGSNVYTPFDKYIASSANGQTIAISNPGTSSLNGEVKIYTWLNNAWVQRGATITGGLYFGISLSLSENGMVIAIGSRSHVAVYKYTSSWNPIFSDIISLHANEDFATSIALSNDASIMAIGSPNYTDFINNVYYCGQVRLLSLDNYITNV